MSTVNSQKNNIGQVKNAASYPQRSSSAYDYSFFENYNNVSRKNGHSSPKSGSGRKSAQKKTAAPAAARKLSKKEAARLREKARMRAAVVLAVFIAVGTLVMMLASKVAMHELTAQVAGLTASYTDLVNEHEAMMVTFEQRMSSIAVEERALALGMQRREASQTHWIAIENGDIFEVATEKENQPAGIPDILSFFDRG